MLVNGLWSMQKLRLVVLSSVAVSCYKPCHFWPGAIACVSLSLVREKSLALWCRFGFGGCFGATASCHMYVTCRVHTMFALGGSNMYVSSKPPHTARCVDFVFPRSVTPVEECFSFSRCCPRDFGVWDCVTSFLLFMAGVCLWSACRGIKENMPLPQDLRAVCIMKKVSNRDGLWVGRLPRNL